MRFSLVMLVCGILAVMWSGCSSSDDGSGGPGSGLQTGDVDSNGKPHWRGGGQ